MSGLEEGGGEGRCGAGWVGKFKKSCKIGSWLKLVVAKVGPTTGLAKEGQSFVEACALPS